MQTGLALLVLLPVTDRAGMSNSLQSWHAAAGVVVGLGIVGTGMAFLIYYYLLQELAGELTERSVSVDRSTSAVCCIGLGLAIKSLKAAEAPAGDRPSA
jgi:hypothetical protein